MGWIVLVIVTVGIAWVANRRRRRKAWATLGIAFLSALVFQMLAAWELGYLDPFAPIALLISLLVTGPISLAVGWLLWRRRRTASPDTRW
ncbi:MAG: hypothetical protein PWQ61_1742 [Betaproteobacteria bacterium]|nr:hypothetical protein [Betaproteobacteria bacterium]